MDAIRRPAFALMRAGPASSSHFASEGMVGDVGLEPTTR